MTKKEFIQKLIVDAQTNIWKNELAIAYKESGNQSDLSVDATKDIIKRDQDYILFLQTELAVCES